MLTFRARKGAKRDRATDRLRLFYCGDIHGSDVCFRKFINAGAHYDAGVLILGGDITGKALVPIVALEGGGWRGYLHGEERTCASEEELELLRQAIGRAGFYPVEMTPEDVASMEQSPERQGEEFRKAMIRQVQGWTELAVERLRESGRECLVMPGNDDEYFIDEYLGDGEEGIVRNVDGRVVELANGVEVLSLAWSNATPWASAREFSEERIAERLRELSGQLERPESAIFNIHVPPFGTGIDTVQKLDANLRPVVENGMPVEIPCGSTAVRQAIEEVQPLLALHGHIHESKGDFKLGRTLCINPGSDYASGRLHGALIDLTPERVERHIFTEG
jgi:Icc-related predicted phosphoesterase